MVVARYIAVIVPEWSVRSDVRLSKVWAARAMARLPISPRHYVAQVSHSNNY